MDMEKLEELLSGGHSSFLELRPLRVKPEAFAQIHFTTPPHSPPPARVLAVHGAADAKANSSREILN
jgi:hypothetical protein